MKVRNVQFGERKNPDSSRVHGLRLAVNSLPAVDTTEPQKVRGEAPPSLPSPRSVETFELSLTETNEATGEKAQKSSPLLTVEEVAHLLHVPVSWVYGRTRRRSLERLPGYRIGKYWRFREDEIHEWLKHQRGGLPGA